MTAAALTRTLETTIAKPRFRRRRRSDHTRTPSKGIHEFFARTSQMLSAQVRGGGFSQSSSGGLIRESPIRTFA